jgi:hypothetical protein
VSHLIVLIGVAMGRPNAAFRCIVVERKTWRQHLIQQNGFLLTAGGMKNTPVKYQEKKRCFLAIRSFPEYLVAVGSAGRYLIFFLMKWRAHDNTADSPSDKRHRKPLERCLGVEKSFQAEDGYIAQVEVTSG